MPAVTNNKKFMKPFILLLLFFLSTDFLFAQDTLKRLYMGNDTHTDLMYNGTEDKWYENNQKMADFYLKLGEETKNEPPEARSKWNYDVAWTVYMLEKKTAPEYFKRIIAQIKNDQASVPYNFTLPVYGCSNIESVIRSFYYGGYLQRKYDIDVSLAVCQENATIPLGLASVWAGCGAKYSWKGVCNCATKTNTKGTRKNEIYWYTGLDSSKILMKWYSNYGWNAELGGYAELLEPTVAVIQMDTLCGSKRYPYNIAAAFGKGWDNMVNYSFDLQWGINHRTRPGTKLILSNEVDFFKDFEKNYGSVLPAVTEAYGNEWDLLPASLAKVSGEIKTNIEQLRNAEALAAIAAVYEPGVFDKLKKLKEDFLYAISVYNAHGWTIDGPVKREEFAAWIRLQQQRMQQYVTTLLQEAIKNIGSKIIKTGNEKNIFVFNALNWERTDIADILLNDETPFSVKDVGSNKIVASQIIEKEGKKFIRFLAEKIPSAGYKVYSLLPIIKQVNQNIFAQYNDGKIETPFYKITVTKNGSITSLIDKKANKEYVKDVLNYPGAGGKENGDAIILENNGPVSVSLRCSSGEGLKHSTLITLFKNLPRVEINNTIQQNFSDVQHWKYNFNIANADTWHEEVGAVIKAKTIAAGGHYANQNARYDYLSLNHFVQVGNKNEGITLSNLECLFMKLGNSTPEKLDGNSSEINILIGGQVDKDKNLGMYNQGGDSVFVQSFALLPRQGSFSKTHSMKFALEHQNPLVTGIVTGGSILPADKFSFFSNTNPDVLLWSLKPGEESGTTLRFWNMGDKAVSVNTSFTKNLLKATEATHVETDISNAPVKNKQLPIQFRLQQMKTCRVWFK
jgi:alpha-mannosidase